MSKSKKRDHRKPRRAGPPTRLELRLGEAQRLLQDGKLGEAHALLEALDKANPTHPDVLSLRLAAAAETRDSRLQYQLAERLTKVHPNDPTPHVILAGSCLMNGWPALALRAFRDVLARWPDDEEAAKARETVANLERDLPKDLEEVGLGGDRMFDLACLHEEVQAHLAAGRFGEAKKSAAKLLEQRPGFRPALNNLTNVLMIEGDWPAAGELCRRVLATTPDNVHARANLARVLFLSGRHAESRTEAEALKQLKPTRTDEWAKVAETLTFLGDDDGVLGAVEAAWDAETDPPPELRGVLHHLGAVASYRLGREHEARGRWQRAVENDPSLEFARANLAELEKPRESQSAGWAFPLQQWVSRRLFDALTGLASSAAWRKSEAGAAGAIRTFLADHPEFAALLPVLLDRGDPLAQHFAFRVAMMANTPESVAVIRDFEKGSRGPEAARDAARRVLAAPDTAAPAGA